MTNEARDIMRNSILPVFLGDNSRSRFLSSLLFHRFGLIPMVCDKRQSPWSFLSLTCRFYKLYKTDDQSILTEQLLRLADKHPEKTLVLVPASEDYEMAVKQHSGLLEAEFIISNVSDILTCPPIADMTV